MGKKKKLLTLEELKQMTPREQAELEKIYDQMTPEQRDQVLREMARELAEELKDD